MRDDPFVWMLLALVSFGVLAAAFEIGFGAVFLLMTVMIFLPGGNND